MRPFALTLQNGKKKYSLEFKLKALELSNERGSLIISPNKMLVQIILNVGRKFNQGKLTGKTVSLKN